MPPAPGRGGECPQRPPGLRRPAPRPARPASGGRGPCPLPSLSFKLGHALFRQTSHWVSKPGPPRPPARPRPPSLPVRSALSRWVPGRVPDLRVPVGSRSPSASNPPVRYCSPHSVQTPLRSPGRRGRLSRSPGRCGRLSPPSPPLCQHPLSFLPDMTLNRVLETRFKLQRRDSPPHPRHESHVCPPRGSVSGTESTGPLSFYTEWSGDDHRSRKPRTQARLTARPLSSRVTSEKRPPLSERRVLLT